MNRFIGRSRHIEQEKGGDVACLLLAGLIDTAVRDLAHSPRDPRFDRAFEVDFITIFESAYHPIGSWPDPLEIAAHLRQQLGITQKRGLKEIAAVAIYADFAQPAPVAAVVGGDIIPF